jgi:hypothetical protein
MAKNDYTPPDDAAHAFTRFKRANDTAKALLPEVKDFAARELKAGATVRDLANLTGLTDELFRRIARAEGVERLRPPTVGREAKTPPADEPEQRT